MRNDDLPPVSRRRLLWGALLGAGSGMMSRRAVGEFDPPELASGIWSGFDGRITERTLAEAEKLFGLHFTESERRLMLGGAFEAAEEGYFHRQLASLRRLRSQEMSNDLAPALKFDPRLPGTAYPEQGDAIELAPVDIGPLPRDPAEIAFASVRHQARWLARGEMTSRGLTEIYLDRIRRHADALKCFITVTSDAARAQADEADRERAAGRARGPLHGIPCGVKDLLDTAGIPTTWGAEPFRDRIPACDSAVVERLRQAGAVMLGKTSVGALAWGEVWFGGETRNPWNTREGSSGSSAGSAAATAAGLCSFAIGTETLGSIVSPADRTGIVGLRPTFGRVSRAGAMALCWSLDKIGAMCRHVEDAAIILGVLNGYDRRDPSSIGMGFRYDGNTPVSDLTIGFDPRWFEGDDAKPAHADALRAIRGTGARIREIEVAELPVDEIMAPLHAESAAAFDELTLSGRDEMLRRQVQEAWPNAFRRARFFSAVDYVQADRLRRRIMERAQDLFRQADLLIGPSLGNQMLTLTNFTGHPCLTVRAGFEWRQSRSLFGHPENDTDPVKYRVPTSISLWSGLFEEGRLIVAGRALESALAAAAEKPPGFAA